MSDIQCPYCDADQEINHDDGYGYEEDKLHEQQCGKCDKYFTYSTMASFYYTPYKADCLNGAEHDLQPVIHHPKMFPDWVRCKCCGYEKRGEYKAPWTDTPSH